MDGLGRTQILGPPIPAYTLIYMDESDNKKPSSTQNVGEIALDYCARLSLIVVQISKQCTCLQSEECKTLRSTNPTTEKRQHVSKGCRSSPSIPPTRTDAATSNARAPDA